MQPTGRSFNQYTEYTVAVRVNPPVQISGGMGFHGTKYWFNLTPECTNEGDPACETDQYFVSNVTAPVINGFRSNAQQGSFAAINSAIYHYSWENWCNIAPPVACSDVSYGLIGTVVQ